MTISFMKSGSSFNTLINLPDSAITCPFLSFIIDSSSKKPCSQSVISSGITQAGFLPGFGSFEKYAIFIWDFLLRNYPWAWRHGFCPIVVMVSRVLVLVPVVLACHLYRKYLLDGVALDHHSLMSHNRNHRNLWTLQKQQSFLLGDLWQLGSTLQSFWSVDFLLPWKSVIKWRVRLSMTHPDLQNLEVLDVRHERFVSSFLSWYRKWSFLDVLRGDEGRPVLLKPGLSKTHLGKK